MEKGKRYALILVEASQGPFKGRAIPYGPLAEDSSGPWLYDPDKMYEKGLESVLFLQQQLVELLNAREVEKTAFASMLSELLTQWREVANEKAKLAESVREANTLFTAIADLEELIESWESNNG